MIKIDQEIIDKSYGDCQDLPIDAVPNFIRHGARFNLVLRSFLKTCGWILDYCSGHFYADLSKYAEKFENKYRRPDISTSINGFFAASVKSKTYKNTNHCVVIDVNGIVVHDPNPNKLYQDENIIKTESLIHWDIVSPRMDDEWKAWKRTL